MAGNPKRGPQRRRSRPRTPSLYECCDEQWEVRRYPVLSLLKRPGAVSGQHVLAVKKSIAAVVFAFALSSCAQAAEPVDFAHDVLPLLELRCAECHTNGTYEGGLSLDTRAALIDSGAVLPGNAAKSELISRVSAADPDDRMPPEGQALSDRQIAILRAWIDQGLRWEPGFSFKETKYTARLEPRRPELPPTADGASNPIDRILAAYYREHGVEPPGTIDDRTFIRRVYLDVVGLLPEPDELDLFLQDTAPDKRGRLALKLLDNDAAYAEHWLTFWNDLLRNDYLGTGYIDGGRKQITAWLYRSLSENRPYDAFVRELVSPTPESEGFIRGIKWRGNVNAAQTTELQFAQNVSQVFLGINMKCASCHDSFIDHWKLSDAYGLAAVTAEESLEIHRCDKPTGQTATAGFIYPELGQIDPESPRAERLAQLAFLITHERNGRFTRTVVNRIWQRVMGRGIVHPVDAMDNPPWSEDLLDHLAVHLADHGYDLKRTLQLIVTSRAYQSPAAVAQEPSVGEEFVFVGPAVKRMTAEQFVDAVWSITSTGPKTPLAKLASTEQNEGQTEPTVEQLEQEDEQAPQGGAQDRPVRAALVGADQLMRSLGRPNREQVVSTRPDELTTLEALELSNGQILADLVARGAANVLRHNPDLSGEDLASWIYKRSLSRAPNRQELAAAKEISGTPATEEGLADLLWSVFMLPEFQLIQ